MDNRTGEIHRMTAEDWAKLPKEERPYFQPIEPTEKQTRLMRVGRNERCPCGSGKKFKKCCMCFTPTTRNGFRP